MCSSAAQPASPTAAAARSPNRFAAKPATMAPTGSMSIPPHSDLVSVPNVVLGVPERFRGTAPGRSVVDFVDVGLVGLDLAAVLFERDGESITDEVLVGDRASLALEVAFGDDDLVADLEVRHAGKPR